MGRQPVGYLLNNEATSWMPVNGVTISSGDVRENPSSSSDAVLGQVWVGSTHEAICIPANCMKVLQGRTSKIT